MKMHILARKTSFSLIAGILSAIGAVITAQAAAPALQGQITLRPLTPQDIKDYGLTNVPNIQGASGLSTVGVGQPAYLEALVNNAVTNADITNVTWVLTVRPPGSAAVLTASPLGTNVPTYKMADRFNNSGAAVYKVPQVAGNPGPILAGRTLLRPDVPGLYTVSVSIRTASSGSTNLTQDITAGTYMGISTCAFCHSGGVAAPDKFTGWTNTLHATFFTKAIDGLKSDHYGKNCISCHTVGYDTNSLAVNGGFDDVARSLNWTFPTNLVAGNWAALTNKLKNLANIQCENCHGPGSEHAFGEISNPHSPEAKAAVAVSFVVGDCAQCHDSKPNHLKVAEWGNSLHARATRTPSGPTRFNCVRCHTAPGFKQFIDNAGTTNSYVTNTVYEAITCSACHDPHDASNPHQLRADNIYTLPEGTTVTNVGLGGLCMECHHSRNGSAVTNIANFQQGKPTWAGGSSFGPHDSTAGDMVEGVNGYTYGKFIPSGAHSYSIENVCVGCHMNDHFSTNSASRAYTHVGGHSFSMAWSDGATNYENTVVCAKCHGPIDSFDMVRKDYNGDGVIEGIQTEVQHLLDELSRLLPPTNYVASGNYVADGLVKTSLTVRTNWPTKFMNAAWNWQFVDVEGSHGIHNAPYAIGVLKASIADLTDDADHDGISDTWENAKFGSITAYDGLDDPDHDGVNNSLEIAAGTNPLLVDSDGDGISDLAELQAGSNPLDSQDVPNFLVHIYGAGELEFASEAGKTYQIQQVTELSSSWQTVGTNIPGTGGMISRLVSTRNGGAQAFYRVVKLTP